MIIIHADTIETQYHMEQLKVLSSITTESASEREILKKEKAFRISWKI